MNGEEAVIRQPQPNNRFSYNQNVELTPEEMMDLTVFGAMPVAKTVYKVMESAIVDARNDAMECDPSLKDKRASLMDIAHGMDQFYKKVRSKIEFAQTEHLSDVRQKALQEELQDQAKIEEIIMLNVQGKI
jgi:hypothetical protein